MSNVSDGKPEFNALGRFAARSNAGRILRFGISGGLGVLVGLVLYELTYALSSDVDHRATFSYVVSYLVGIVAQHGLHRYITFRDRASPYMRSLRRTFVVYPLVLFVASGANFAMVQGLGWHHRIAFWLTVGIAAGLSFIGLSLFAFKRGHARS